MRTIVPLNFPSAQTYKALVPEEFRSMLEGKPPKKIPANTQVYGFGELENGEPIGVILASSNPDIKLAVIHVVNSGHADELLQEMERELIEKSKPNIWLVTDERSHSIREAAVRLGWKGPVPYMTTYYLDAEAFHPPWFERSYPVSQKYQFFPWGSLKKGERERIDFYTEQGRFLTEMNPWRYGEDIDLGTSFGMRYEGEVVGWSITHRIKPNMLRYSVLYVEREHRSSGEIIKLLMKSIRAQQSAHIHYSEFEVSHMLATGKWRDFVKKRLAPYAYRTMEEVLYWKP